MLEINPEDILSPQIREMYQALLQTGRTAEALTLARESVAAQDSVEVTDYLGQKRRMVYNMWIHNVAKALETKTCSRGPMPCNLCLSQARDIGGELWRIILQFLKDLGSNHWGTPWELLNLLQNVLETKPVIITPPPKSVTLQIKKAPPMEARYAATNDSA